MSSNELPYSWTHESKQGYAGLEALLTPDKIFVPTNKLYELADKYPHGNGYGFDLRSIIDKYILYVSRNPKSRFFVDYVSSESGSEYKILISKDKISIMQSGSLLGITLSVINDRMNINALTKYEDGSRHPDLFAGHFMDFGWELLRSHAPTNWHMCVGNWNGYSENYTEFHENRLEGQDDKTAAKNTWTGRFYSAHGFGEVSSVSPSTDINGENQITVEFAPNATILE